MEKDIPNLIGGEWEPGKGQPFDDVDPGKPSEVIATYSSASSQQVMAAAKASSDASRGWRRTPLLERAAILSKAAEIVARNSEAWGAELTREEGKTLPEGIGEVRRAADVLRYFAAEALQEQGQHYASPRAGETIWVLRRPLGSILTITPFNFPIFIPALKIAPALLYGNTVVWKPAPQVPLLTYRFATALLEAGVPEGVLNVTYGEGTTAQQLIESSDISAVSFTGSTAIGRLIMEKGAHRGIPVQAEMGGKNAAVIADDAPMDLALQKVVFGAMASSGQKCTGTSRIILDENIADEFLDRLVSEVESLVVGYGLDPGVDLGPVISAEAQSNVLQRVEEAILKGATALTATARPEQGSDGFYVAPAILETEPENPIATEEVFGPVLSVIRARDFNHALYLANKSQYGLSGAVFTSDLTRAMRAVQEFDVGVLHINSETTGADPHVPVGGMKSSSSHSRELGRYARDFYTAVVTAYITSIETEVPR